MSLKNDQSSPDHYSSNECESITPSVKKMLLQKVMWY